MSHLLVRLACEDGGQDLIEYAFLAVFAVLVVYGGLVVVSDSINTNFANIGAQVAGS